jgi:hypothetical protein
VTARRFRIRTNDNFCAISHFIIQVRSVHEMGLVRKSCEAPKQTAIETSTMRSQRRSMELRDSCLMLSDSATEFS